VVVGKAGPASPRLSAAVVLLLCFVMEWGQRGAPIVGSDLPQVFVMPLKAGPAVSPEFFEFGVIRLAGVVELLAGVFDLLAQPFGIRPAEGFDCEHWSVVGVVLENPAESPRRGSVMGSNGGDGESAGLVLLRHAGSVDLPCQPAGPLHAIGTP